MSADERCACPVCTDPEFFSETHRRWSRGRFLVSAVLLVAVVVQVITIRGVWDVIVAIAFAGILANQIAQVRGDRP